MRLVYKKKKKGSTFLEIILALSIIGIMSVTIFNNIAFSLKANKEINKRQSSSILAQHVFEEIKNMGNDTFKNLAESMADNQENTFLGTEEYKEIIDKKSKKKFEEDGSSINTFKVFNKKHTELYVKVSLPDLNKTSPGAGLVNDYSAIVESRLVEEWKTLNNCEVAVEITKQDDELYNVRFYEDGKWGSPIPKRKVELVPKVSLEGDHLGVYFNKTEIFSKDITRTITEELTKVDMYIKDNTGGNLFYIFSNDASLGLNIYLEQNEGNSDFITYGSNIRVYSNEEGKTPYGENITTESVCDFTVEVLKKDGDNFKNLVKLKGHKKFKRFEL